MKNQPRNKRLKVGSRFRLSALGIERCPRLKSCAGIIVGLSPTGSSFRVLLDGRKQAVTLHESYIELDPPSGALHRQIVT
ncbi:hypothetical protein SAMN05444050_4385 [Afipia sp. GAS231]|nr:hypothetical protein SAMN05444050_4385 [Afipia sp. GAS231]